MKKLYSLLFALLTISGLAQAQVVFDFTGDTAYEQFGLAGFSSNDSHDGDISENVSVTSGDVTITVTPVEKGNANRMWTGSLRLYGGTLTIASSGKNITAINFTLNSSKWGSNTANVGTLETGKWTGDAASVVITIGGNTQIKSISVTIGGDEPGGGDDLTPAIDWTSSATAPLTVAQVQEKAAQLEPSADSGVEVYVKGKVSQIEELNVGFGNATYYISDDGTESNQFYVFRGKYLNGVNFTTEDQLKVGDDVVVVGVIKNYVKDGISTLEINQGNKLYSINGNTGEDTPEPTVKEYTKIADVKAAVTANREDVVFKANDLLVTYVNGSSVYVFDGTDGLLIFGSNSGIKAGDKITADVKGELYLYYGLTEIAVSAYENLTVNSSDNAVEPQKVTVADVNDNPKDYENELVQIEGLYAQSEALASRNISFMDDYDNPVVVRDNWNVLTGTTFDTESEYTVTAFVSIYNGNVQLYPRTAEDVDNGEEPVAYELEGEGTFEKPYTVADVQHLNGTEDCPTEAVWVTGYIVGAAKSSMSKIINQQGEDLQATNIVLADEATEESTAQMIPVQLTTNKDESKDIRSKLNLVDHFDYLGKQVWVFGTIENYFSVAGVKNVTDYSLDGESTGVNAVADDAKAAGRIYNIAGQRVSAIGKGFYIVGDKKVLSE